MTLLADRRWARDEVARLDPERDNERIAHLTAEVRYGDPLLVALLYTVAFCRQMAVPSIARVVHRGGASPIMVATRKRNDDTLMLFGEFMRSGHSSPRGRAAITRMNEIHARFPIDQDQMLYTLASLTFEQERIPRGLGLDPLSETEKLANFYFWREVGRLAGIEQRPETYEAYWEWTRSYEASHWGYSDGGRAVVDAMIADFVSRVPRALARPARGLLLAAMEDDLLDVFGLEHPDAAVRKLARALVAGYFRGRALLPDPGERSWAEAFGRAYPPQPDLSQVGFSPRG
ncbi:MAG: DUF2236 domain-containing protein [Solirubrobacterales bacterium]|nr:DUF2236 domain-containing protein [Solirubrobacterales bacterium]